MALAGNSCSQMKKKSNTLPGAKTEQSPTQAEKAEHCEHRFCWAYPSFFLHKEGERHNKAVPVLTVEMYFA